MNKNNKKDPAERGEIITPNYCGPDRRRSGFDVRDPELSKLVRTDDRGYRILELPTKAQRRRADDKIVDPLEILAIDLFALGD